MEQHFISDYHESRTLHAEVLRLKVQLAEKEAQISKLRKEVNEDHLTGALTRRAFEKRLAESFSYFKRYGRDGVMLAIDLNDFKEINDTYGHAAGDAVLQHVSQLLVKQIRTTDVVARLGGDEFNVILNEINELEAMKKAHDLVQVIEAAPCLFDGLILPVNISIGVCSFSRATSRKELMDKADSAMYAHKVRIKQSRKRA